MARLPQALRMTGLPPAEQFAAIELFRGTMARHSVIVYRDDTPSPYQPVSFAGDVFRSCVPIRMSETICVQERLPAGAAGVLINQNHTYTDLLMTIDAAEKRMFDAIDGIRTIDDISETMLPSSLPQRQLNARTLFERLWWYDQVVFDTSKSG
jgi:hypothetical protein